MSINNSTQPANYCSDSSQYHALAQGIRRGLAILAVNSALAGALHAQSFPFDGVVQLSNLAAASAPVPGLVFNGIANFGSSGYSVAAAGDINGDGVDDLLIGDPNAAVSAGQTYVVFGNTALFQSGGTFDLSALNSSNPGSPAGLIINGIDPALIAGGGDFSGASVSPAGDFNHDGVDDLIIGARGGDPNGTFSAGEAYVVFGNSAGGFPASGVIDLSALNTTAANGAAGLLINGIDNFDGAGSSVAAAGDVNGDGIDDVMVGAPAADLPGSINQGEVYVIFGQSMADFPASGVIDLSALNTTAPNGTAGLTITGINANDRVGDAINTAGDLNADGADDIVIGSDGPGNRPGRAYVVFGSSSGAFPASGVIDLAALNTTTANGSAGLFINGISTFDGVGASVKTAGDVNADGTNDVLIGADGINRAYVIFGASNGGFPASGVINLASLNTTAANAAAGLVINAAGGRFGRSVSNAGDINGDGIDDLLAGAPGSSVSPVSQAFAVFGQSQGDLPGSGTIDLSALNSITAPNGNPGVAAVNNVTGSFTGYAVDTAGDINGDGFDDLLIGAEGAGPSGITYVVFGSDNFAPLSLLPGPQVTNEDASLAFNNSIRIIDLDNVEPVTTVLELLGANRGDLTVTPGSGANVSGDGTDSVTLIGTPVEINVALSTVTYAPAADINGDVGFTISTDDGVETAEANTTITITPVNDPPGFVVGPNLVELDTAGTVTIPAWATGISPGPTNEAGQSLTFDILNVTNPTLFAQLPQINPQGDLTFVPAFNQSGLSTVVLQLVDDGPGTPPDDNTGDIESFAIEVLLEPTADLAITKVNNVNFVTGNDPVTYVIAVTNIGTGSASNATVQDLLPDTMINASWTCDAGTGASCMPSGVGDIVDTTVVIPPSASVVYTLTVDLNVTETDRLINTATVTSASLDRDLTNNTATDDDIVAGVFADDFEDPDDE